MDWKNAFEGLFGAPKPVPVPEVHDPEAKLEVSVKTFLAPLLREDGFKGSGRRYRRIADGMAQIVEVQGASGGGAFTVNMGIHHEALLVAERDEALTNIKELHCLLRRRLTDGTTDQWWRHQANQPSMDAAVQAAAELYLKVGRSLLNAEWGPSATLLTISADELRGGRADISGFRNTQLVMAEGLAGIRKWQGRPAEAKAFAGLATKLTQSETIRRQLAREFG